MVRRLGPSSRRAAHRRLVLASMARAIVTVAVLIVAYYLLPLNRDLGTGLWFGTALAALALAVGLELRAIRTSTIPRIRALELIAITVPGLLVLYATMYTLLEYNDPASFTEPVTRTDTLYFTTTVFATVGFGDIAPVTELARVVTMSQMVVGLITVGVVAKVVLGAVQAAVEERRTSTHGNPTHGNPTHSNPSHDNQEPRSEAATEPRAGRARQDGSAG